MYADKYLLAESLGNMSLAATLNALELLGVNPQSLKKMRAWVAEGLSVTLRLKAEERCVFDRETTREVDSSVYERDYGVGKITDKVVTTIHEWFWNFSVDYKLFIYAGSEPDDEPIVLQSRLAKMELMTTTKDTPRREVVVRDAVDINLTYLLQRVNTDNQFAFKIDRWAKDCHTPRRNPEVSALIEFVLRVAQWAVKIDGYFQKEIFPIQTGQGGAEKFGLSSLNLKSVFCPVAPLFMPSAPPDEPAVASEALVAIGGPENAKDESKVTMTLNDLNRFLGEQKRSLSEKFVDLAKVFPDGIKLVTIAEAHIVLIALHLSGITWALIDGINYIEDLIRKQLVAAIGREVSPVDFQNYMLFHNARIFKEEYRPKAFCYPVRRPEHYPEGIVSIEAHLADGTMPDPIQTIVSRHEPETPMHFAISASAKVAFKGEVHLHGYVGHQFADNSGMRMTLNARARQFSSFLVLVGRISGPGLFDPQFGMIVQNKDEFELPLDLETIPTPKEFRDAIESLSPEQQEFCKLYRGMQLASTLFGVLVLQIKPQLEKILKMESDSLTKEIRLTQDLLDLFLQYQIPSDLLSFGGQESSSKDERLEGVKVNVNAMKTMIERAKKKEIEDAAEKAQYERTESLAARPPPMPRAPMKSAPPSARGGGGGAGRGASRKQMAAAPMMMSSMAAPQMSLSAPPPPSGPPAAVPVSAVVVQEVPAPAEAPVQASTKFDSGSSGNADVDFTKLPSELDAKFDKLDSDAALRPTILNVGKHWNKKYQETLLGAPRQKGLDVKAQKLERNACFDLLDALTNSGCVPFDDATLHIVMASTHCFADNIMNTLVKDNINPIEKLERSQLIVATTIHRRPAHELLTDAHVDRIKEFSAANDFAIEETKK